MKGIGDGKTVGPAIHRPLNDGHAGRPPCGDLLKLGVLGKLQFEVAIRLEKRYWWRGFILNGVLFTDEELIAPRLEHNVSRGHAHGFFVLCGLEDFYVGGFGFWRDRLMKNYAPVNRAGPHRFASAGRIV